MVVWQPCHYSGSPCFPSIQLQVSPGQQNSLSVCHIQCVCVCAVKFLCQIKSSLTRLQQTRCDSVQGRPNRAPIQLPATGSFLSTLQRASSQFFLSGTRGKTAQHLDGTLPMYLSNISLCYREFKLQTSGAMSEHPGRAPVWGIILPGLCSFLCNSLWDNFLNWGLVKR